METQSSSRRTALSVFLIIMFCTAVMCFVFTQKHQYHIDEIWSFGLSNSYNKPFFFTISAGINGNTSPEKDSFIAGENEDYQSYFYHWNDSRLYHDYITVQPEQRFEYANVYHNQEMDTHPPLYYFIIHTICSFFPDRFSKWFGMVPNLIFYALSMLILFFIARELQSSDGKAMLTILLWGLSRAGISTVVYIRMYMLLTLLALCLTWLHLLLLKDFKYKYAVLIVIVDILGFLTQYYYYIYAFFITAFTCLILLRRKKIKQMLGFGSSILGSVCISIAVFPAVIRHTISGTWSEVTAENIVTDKDAFSSLMLLIAHDYAGIFAFIIITVTFLLYMLDVLKILRRKEKTISGSSEKEKSIYLLSPAYNYMCKGNALVLATVLCTGTLTCKLSPNMGDYQDRYIFFILPLIAVTFTDIIILGINKAAGIFSKTISSKKIYLTAGIIMLVCITYGNLNGNNAYLRNAAMTENDSDLETLITDRHVILVSDYHQIHAYSYAFCNAAMVCSADGLSDALAEVIDRYEGADPLLLVVDSTLGQSDIVDTFLQYKTSCEFQYLSSTHYSLNYYDDLYIYELTPHNN